MFLLYLLDMLSGRNIQYILVMFTDNISSYKLLYIHIDKYYVI